MTHLQSRLHEKLYWFTLTCEKPWQEFDIINFVGQQGGDSCTFGLEEDKDNGQCRRDLVCAALGLENNGTCQVKSESE